MIYNRIINSYQICEQPFDLFFELESQNYIFSNSTQNMVSRVSAHSSRLSNCRSGTIRDLIAGASRDTRTGVRTVRTNLHPHFLFDLLQFEYTGRVGDIQCVATEGEGEWVCTFQNSAPLYIFATEDKNNALMHYLVTNVDRNDSCYCENITSIYMIEELRKDFYKGSDMEDIPTHSDFLNLSLHDDYIRKPYIFNPLQCKIFHRAPLWIFKRVLRLERGDIDTIIRLYNNWTTINWPVILSCGKSESVVQDLAKEILQISVPRNTPVSEHLPPDCAIMRLLGEMDKEAHAKVMRMIFSSENLYSCNFGGYNASVTGFNTLPRNTDHSSTIHHNGTIIPGRGCCVLGNIGHIRLMFDVHPPPPDSPPGTEMENVNYIQVIQVETGAYPISLYGSTEKFTRDFTSPLVVFGVTRAPKASEAGSGIVLCIDVNGFNETGVMEVHPDPISLKYRLAPSSYQGLGEIHPHNIRWMHCNPGDMEFIGYCPKVKGNYICTVKNKSLYFWGGDEMMNMNCICPYQHEGVTYACYGNTDNRLYLLSLDQSVWTELCALDLPAPIRAVSYMRGSNGIAVLTDVSLHTFEIMFTGPDITKSYCRPVLQVDTAKILLGVIGKVPSLPEETTDQPRKRGRPKGSTNKRKEIKMMQQMLNPECTDKGGRTKNLMFGVCQDRHDVYMMRQDFEMNFFQYHGGPENIINLFVRDGECAELECVQGLQDQWASFQRLYV